MDGDILAGFYDKSRQLLIYNKGTVLEHSYGLEISDRLCFLHFEAKSLCNNGFYHYFYCEECGNSINVMSMDEIGNGHLLWEL